MKDEGPLTRRRSKKVRDSLELTKKRDNLYPSLESENDSEDNYSHSNLISPDDHVAQPVGTLKNLSDSEHTEYSDDEVSDGSLEVDSAIESHQEVPVVDTLEVPSSFTDSTLFKIIIAVLLCLPFVLPLLLQSNAAACSLKLDTLLEEELDAFSFLSLSKKSEIKQNIISKIDSSTNSDPLSVYIMFQEDQRVNVTSFANNIAHIFSKCSSTEAKSSESFSLGFLKSHLGDLDSLLEHKIESSTSAIVVQDFTELGWDQAKLFMRYCDNENAPYKDRMYVFTSVVKECDPLRPDKSAERALLDAWSEEDETIEALAVRISAISVCFNSS